MTLFFACKLLTVEKIRQNASETKRKLSSLLCGKYLDGKENRVKP